jgi:hypothetical protein
MDAEIAKLLPLAVRWNIPTSFGLSIADRMKAPCILACNYAMEAPSGIRSTKTG